jgi:hypothetical protein
MTSNSFPDKILWISSMGDRPKKRLNSRPNWEGFWYPTSAEAARAVNFERSIHETGIMKGTAFMYCAGDVEVICLKRG